MHSHNQTYFSTLFAKRKMKSLYRTNKYRTRTARNNYTDVLLLHPLNLWHSISFYKTILYNKSENNGSTTCQHRAKSILHMELKGLLKRLKVAVCLGNVIEILKKKISKAESRAENVESKCKLLTETNMELNEELSSLKSRGNTSDDRVNSLEMQLKKSDIQLHHAVASVEASQEKQSMLDSTIKDMENLIEGLKSKVSKAESQAESAEDKCIILSESNSDLNEELNFLRDKMESLEVSLRQSEETKKATAKDISIRTKLITDLVMQVAFEREHLQNQISSLRKENKILVKHLQQTNKGPESPDSKDFSLSKHGFTTATNLKESKEEAAELSASSFEDELYQ